MENLLLSMKTVVVAMAVVDLQAMRGGGDGVVSNKKFAKRK